MGRKTWESLPERFRPLPNRTNIIVTRDLAYAAGGAHIVHSIDGAITFAKTQVGNEEICIMGGQEIYTLGMPYANRLYLTLIESTPPLGADAFFPPYVDTFTTEVSREEHFTSTIPFSFVTLERAH